MSQLSFKRLSISKQRGLKYPLNCPPKLPCSSVTVLQSSTSFDLMHNGTAFTPPNSPAHLPSITACRRNHVACPVRLFRLLQRDFHLPSAIAFADVLLNFQAGLCDPGVYASDNYVIRYRRAAYYVSLPFGGSSLTILMRNHIPPPLIDNKYLSAQLAI